MFFLVYKKQMETFGGIIVQKLKSFEDERGKFSEIFVNKHKTYPDEFVQDNCSVSKKGVVRGLHYQIENPQAKLVYVLCGKVLDVVVDLRKSSETFGKWFEIELSADNGLAMYVPEGFAHGFQSLEDNTVFYYKCSDYYSPEHDRTLHFQSLDINWRELPIVMSAKDKLGANFEICDKFP